MMMDHPMMGGGGGVAVMLLTGLFWLVLLGLLIAGLVWIVQGLTKRGGPARRLPTRSPDETPLDILRRRYAAGEVSRDEFERMKRELNET